MNTIDTTLNASDIKCQGCAAGARAAVRQVPGVESAAVDLAAQTVTVTHQPGVPRDALAAALTKAGFPAR